MPLLEEEEELPRLELRRRRGPLQRLGRGVPDAGHAVVEVEPGLAGQEVVIGVSLCPFFESAGNL